MKVVAPQALLTKTIRRCMLGGSSAVLNPVHALVKVEARPASSGEPPRLIFSSTIGAVAINTSMLANVDEPGIIAFNTREVAAAASVMPDGPLVLQTMSAKGATASSRVKLTGSSGRSWTGAITDGDTIQPPPEPKGAAWLRVPTENLRAAIERVSFTAADVLDHQRAQDGVRLEAEPGRLFAIGCGEHMFVMLEQKVELGLKKPWQALVPSIILSQVRDILEEAEEDAAALAAAGADGSGAKPAVDIYSDGNFISVVGPSTLLVAAMPVGDYPPVRLLLDSFPKEALCTLPRLALLESMKACQATAGKVDLGTHFRFGNHEVCMFRKGDSDFEETLPLPAMRPGLDITCKASLNYLLPILKAADEDPELVDHPNGTNILLRTSTYRGVLALMGTAPPV